MAGLRLLGNLKMLNSRMNEKIKQKLIMNFMNLLYPDLSFMAFPRADISRYLDICL